MQNHTAKEKSILSRLASTNRIWIVVLHVKLEEEYCKITGKKMWD
jgi:hypothetical protein